MSKGDFVTPDGAADITPPDTCKAFGHVYELHTDEYGITTRHCNDCGDTAVVLDTECVDGHRQWHPEHDYHFGICRRCDADIAAEPLPQDCATPGCNDTALCAECTLAVDAIQALEDLA